MYESFYGFKERPFTLLPDPDFLFLNEKHRAALEMLESAVASHSGFCVISGEIGAGKTTLIRELLNRLDETVCVGLVSNTHPSFGGLLQWIMAAYGLPSGNGDTLELHKRFIEFTIEKYAQNKHTLLIIDEAQNLNVQALEELRMLSNVNSDRDLVLQVILVGQHQLRDTLQLPELEQFSQRIALNYHLEELNQDETCRYIQHRVSHAGGQPDLFSEDACRAVYRLSGGIPRLINRLCDLSLVYGVTAESRVITAELVDRVGEDQRMSTLHDIPHIDRATEKPEEIAQPLEASTEEKSGPGPSSAAIAAEPPARVGASPGQTQKADRQSPDIAFGSRLSTALLTESDTVAGQRNVTGETVKSSALHKMVVDAELNKRTTGERSALWLLLGVVIMAGGTGWMMRDFWSAGPVAVSIGIEEPAASSATSRPETDLPQTQGSKSLSVADSADPVENAIDAAVEAERKAKQRAAELSREAEKTARLKQESDRIERERRAAEQQLEKQRAAELSREAEKTARLKQESDRIERERRVAEQQLEKQRAARKELERKAQVERKKMAAARAAAKKLAEERTRASARLSEASAAKSLPQAPARVNKSQANFKETVPSAYDADDSNAVVRDVKARLASETAKPVVKKESADAISSLPVSPLTAREEDDGDANVRDAKDEEVEFAANPCHGPTARFLSTCR